MIEEIPLSNKLKLDIEGGRACGYQAYEMYKIIAAVKELETKAAKYDDHDCDLQNTLDAEYIAELQAKAANWDLLESLPQFELISSCEYKLRIWGEEDSYYGSTIKESLCNYIEGRGVPK